MIKDKHHKFYILSKYQNLSKINYLLKNMNMDYTSEYFKKLQQIHNRIIEMMVPFNVTSVDLEQISLPAKFGGLAVGNLTQYSCTASLQRMMTMKDNSDLRKILDERLLKTYEIYSNFQINEMMNKYNSYVNSKHVIVDFNKKYTLRDMMSKVNEHNFIKLFNKVNKRHQIILNSCRYHKFSNAFLRVIPSNITGVHLSNKMFELCLRRRLGKEILHDDKTTKCTVCNNSGDRFGDHALICAHGKGRIYRHDILVKELYNDLIKLGFQAKLEPLNLLRQHNTARPADIKVGDLFNGYEYWLDVGVTLTNYNGGTGKSDINKQAMKYESNKFKKYENEIQSLDAKIKYYPIILQDNGIINDNFNVVLTKLAKKATEKYDKDMSIMKSHYSEKYSALLNKLNAFSIIQHMDL